MNQSRSSRNIKTYTLMMLVALFITCIVGMIYPDAVYAEGNYTSLNGNTDNGEGAKVGEIYWGGSTSRTSLMFFVVDNNTHKVITHGNKRIAFRVFKDQEQQKTYNWCQAKIFKNHFGEDLTDINEVRDADMPYPVIFNEAERRWSGNGGAIDEWLFSEVEYKGRTYERWQKLILEGYGDKLGAEILKELQTNPDITLAVEPLAWNCIYTGDVWGDKPANADSNDYDKKDYYDAGYYGKGGYKPLLFGEVAADSEGYIYGTGMFIDDLGEKADHIFRYASTGMYSAAYANQMAGGKIPDGGLNWKWTNEALGYCMTLEEDQLDIKSIRQSPQRTAASTFSNESLSYALALFNAELKAPLINTYDIDNNPKEPDKCQNPDPSKSLDGNVTIKKVYYTTRKNSTTYETTAEYASETANCTNFIRISDEKEQTGYSLKQWATSTTDKVPGLPSPSVYKTAFKTSEEIEFDYDGKWKPTIINGSIRKGTTPQDVVLDDEEKFIYLLYEKIETLPEPEYSDYNWEIPESYLTRSAYFSTAKQTGEDNQPNGLPDFDFEWTSAAHETCGGHLACKLVLGASGCHDRVVPDGTDYFANKDTMYRSYDSAGNLTYGWGSCNNYTLICNKSKETILKGTASGWEYDGKKSPYDLTGVEGNSVEKMYCSQAHIHTDKCYDYEQLIYLPIFEVVDDGSNKGKEILSGYGIVKSATDTDSVTYDYIVSEFLNVNGLTKYTNDSTAGAEVSGKNTLNNNGSALTGFKIYVKENNSSDEYTCYTNVKLTRINDDSKKPLFSLEYGTEYGTQTVTVALSTYTSRNFGEHTRLTCTRDEHICWDDPSSTTKREAHGITISLDSINSSHHHTEDCNEDSTCVVKLQCGRSFTDNKMTLGITANFSMKGENKVVSTLAGTHGILQNGGTSSLSGYDNDTYKKDFARGTFDEDSQKIDNLNYGFLLYRGDDPVTVANWKSNTPYTLSNLSGISSGAFKSQNTPVSGRQKSTYYKDFKYVFNQMAGADVTTAIKFTIGKGWHTVKTASTAHGLTITACNPDSKDYKLSNTYEAQCVVKVNVFSDYEKTNDGSPAELTNRADAGSITFYPYVQMYYDTENSKDQPINVMGETQRTIKFKDYAEIAVSSSKDAYPLKITSSQWSTHTGAAEALSGLTGGNANTGMILPGGAEFDLSIPKENWKTVTATTYQMLLEDKGKEQVEQTEGNSSVETDIGNIEDNHKTFVAAVQNAFQGIHVVQYVNNNAAADPLTKGSLVRSGETFNQHQLSSDDKYYFNNYNNSKMDVEDVTSDSTYSSKTTELKYVFQVNTQGQITMTDNDGKKSTVLDKGVTPDKISNETAKKLEAKTGVVSALYYGLLTNEGDDSTSSGSFPFTADGNWYNEAFDGITVVMSSTTFQIGFAEPISRSSVLDPKLMPDRTEDKTNTTNGTSLFTNFYSSAFQTYKDGSDISVQFKEGCTAGTKVSDLFKSETFCIPNVTVQDLK